MHKQIFLQNRSNSEPFAEIISSSLYSWQAQSWQWDFFPDLGSLVTIITSDKILFGLVHQVQTGSSDPVRIPYAYKKTEEELKRELPHIFEFLQTTFSCVPLGYYINTQANNKIDYEDRPAEMGPFIYQLPLQPPKIHAFVSLASQSLTKDFFKNSNHLHVLFGHSQSVQNFDELLLAIIKKQSLIEPLSEEQWLNFTRTFSLLTGNNYRRLKLFLQRALE